MRVIQSVSAMQQAARRWRSAGSKIGFVPTMGYLHEGHVSLMTQARRRVGPDGIVVVSIYVNPTQFAPTEDLSRYPRDFARDRRLCREAGVDAIFFPTDASMYPGRDDGLYSTYVVEETLSKVMEGASRPTHFRGVTTIVAKLFNIVLPDLAIFGAKDFQQAAIILRMTRDLNFPVKVIVAPTIRERDGLAMSSRNKYLDPEQRRQAVALWQAIQHARTTVRSRKATNSQALEAELKQQMESNSAVRVDYIQFFDPMTLQPVQRVQRGTHMALAAYLGSTRLIDNALL